MFKVKPRDAGFDARRLSNFESGFHDYIYSRLFLLYSPRRKLYNQGEEFRQMTIKSTPNSRQKVQNRLKSTQLNSSLI